MRYDAMREGFNDELEKIAGEMQGFTRIGRRPIGAERLLEREAQDQRVPSDVVKISAMSAAAQALALMGAGAGGFAVLQRANQDRKLGRQVRLQSQMGQ